MEKLRENLVVIMTLEIIALIIGTTSNIVTEKFFVFWLLFVFIITVLSIVFLLQFRPKYYLLFLLISLSILLIPIVFVYYVVSKIHC